MSRAELRQIQCEAIEMIECYFGLARGHEPNSGFAWIPSDTLRSTRWIADVELERRDSDFDEIPTLWTRENLGVASGDRSA